MNEAIINPWMLYAILQLDNLHNGLGVLGGLSLSAAALAGCVKIFQNLETHYGDSPSPTIPNIVIAVSASIMCGALILQTLLPTTKNALIIATVSNVSKQDLRHGMEYLDKKVDAVIGTLKEEKK